MQQRANSIRMLAAMFAIAGLILIIYSLLAYENGVTGYGSHDGMMGSSTSSQYYTLTNMFLAIGGALMFGCGILYAVVRQPSGALANSPAVLAPVVPFAAGQGSEASAQISSPVPATVECAIPETTVPSAQAETKAPEAAPFLTTDDAESALVLRLLSGDERTIFRTVKDAGGETLQRDIVVTTKMSEAKVSRVIDKLVEKGLVVKERNGMGNKIRIEIEE